MEIWFSDLSLTPNCMLSLGLISYDMELGFSDLFTSYEMELETHVHVWYGVVWYYGMVCITSIVWYVSMV